jgi:hypothetical protein
MQNDDEFLRGTGNFILKMQVKAYTVYTEQHSHIPKHCNYWYDVIIISHLLV